MHVRCIVSVIWWCDWLVWLLRLWHIHTFASVEWNSEWVICDCIACVWLYDDLIRCSFDCVYDWCTDWLTDWCDDCYWYTMHTFCNWQMEQLVSNVWMCSVAFMSLCEVKKCCWYDGVIACLPDWLVWSLCLIHCGFAFACATDKRRRLWVMCHCVVFMIL